MMYCFDASAALKPVMALQVAIVAALKKFRDNLPTILPALVSEYVTKPVTEPLFVEVRCVSSTCYKPCVSST
jgi:hypothetical protein